MTSCVTGSVLMLSSLAPCHAGIPASNGWLFPLPQGGTENAIPISNPTVVLGGLGPLFSLAPKTKGKQAATQSPGDVGV